MLKNVHFAAVGGTKLKNIIDQIGGIGLPRNKQYLGNQWNKMASLKSKPHFAIIACGSNDTDEADRYTRSRYRRGLTDQAFKRETTSTLATWYKDLKVCQENLISKIRSIFEKIRVYFLPILPRYWWGQQGCRMA